MSWSVGQALPVLPHPPFTREELRQYAHASSDHNPIHLDENFAKEAGFDSVIVHGMLSMALMGDYLLATFPDTQFQLKQFRARFRKVTFPGDVLRCEGEVRKVTDDGSLIVDVWTRNQKDEITTDGEALLQPL